MLLRRATQAKLALHASGSPLIQRSASSCCCRNRMAQETCGAGDDRENRRTQWARGSSHCLFIRARGRRHRCL